MVIQTEHTGKKISNPADIANIMQRILAVENEVDRDKEHFWTIGLAASGTIKYIELVSLGTLSDSLVHPREVFRMAITQAVASLILCHNHPSMSTAVSPEDIQITKRLLSSGEILGFGVFDHIVITENSYLSMKEEGTI